MTRNQFIKTSVVVFCVWSHLQLSAFDCQAIQSDNGSLQKKLQQQRKKMLHNKREYKLYTEGMYIGNTKNIRMIPRSKIKLIPRTKIKHQYHR